MTTATSTSTPVISNRLPERAQPTNGEEFQKRLDYPNASRDGRGRLRAAAAVGVGADLEERVAALVDMSVDAVSIDTAHGHSANVVKAIERIKGSRSDLPDLMR